MRQGCQTRTFLDYEGAKKDRLIAVFFIVISRFILTLQRDHRKWGQRNHGAYEDGLVNSPPLGRCSKESPTSKHLRRWESVQAKSDVIYVSKTLSVDVHVPALWKEGTLCSTAVFSYLERFQTHCGSVG